MMQTADRDAGRAGMKMERRGIGSDLTPELNRLHAVPFVGMGKERKVLHLFFFH